MLKRADEASGAATVEVALPFADIHPPLTARQARVEADRCYFCHDAPCVEACPTAIDVPRFIRGIATGNVRGAATTILDANIFGGSCARVCPTEILCEAACVRTAESGQPIAIGALQRHATDWLADRLGEQGGHPFGRAAPTGKRVAVVGAGPAGLSCAHRLARHGHAVTVLEARGKPGGLNEYGIAAYKLAGDFAEREVAFVLSIGGIDVECGRALGADLRLPDLLDGYDAVFLGVGQAGVRQLGIASYTLSGIRHAVDFIAELRQTPERARIAVGRRVIVIGGGNTAVDAAVQARMLGAAEVTIAYRRATERMSATAKERDWARANDVRIRDCLSPLRCVGAGGMLEAVVFAESDPVTGRPLADRPTVTIAGDLVLSAIGQALLLPAHAEASGSEALAIQDGRIVVDAACRTSIARVYAGGDCVAGPDLTVNAVQDGTRAAEAIHRALAEGAG